MRPKKESQWLVFGVRLPAGWTPPLDHPPLRGDPSGTFFPAIRLDLPPPPPSSLRKPLATMPPLCSMCCAACCGPWIGPTTGSLHPLYHPLFPQTDVVFDLVVFLFAGQHATVGPSPNICHELHHSIKVVNTQHHRIHLNHCLKDCLLNHGMWLRFHHCSWYGFHLRKISQIAQCFPMLL